MLRKLNERDHAAVMELIGREPELNLFIIGDIESAGYKHPRVAHWGEFDGAGQLAAILTQYYDSLVFYARAAYDRQGFFKIIQALNFRFFSGESSILEPFTELIPHAKRKDTLLARLNRKCGMRNAECGIDGIRPEGWKCGMRNAECGIDGICPAGLEDAEAIVQLRNGIPEFEAVLDSTMLRQALVNKTARAWIARDDGKIVAVAQTAAESRALAMIIGVATRAEYRRRGYATACVTALCRALQAEGKTLCLFYDNPDAGRIYKRLGFEDIGRWTMLIR